MTGWNLPPGCSVGDLPGNSRQEQEAETFELALYEQFPASMSDEDMEKLSKWVWEAVNSAYSEGYKAGVAEASFMAKMDVDYGD